MSGESWSHREDTATAENAVDGQEGKESTGPSFPPALQTPVTAPPHMQPSCHPADRGAWERSLCQPHSDTEQGRARTGIGSESKQSSGSTCFNI